MPLIMNALDEEQTVVAGGNHFHFKGRQVKYFHNPNIAGFITIDRRDFGFVELPEELAYLGQLKPEQAEKLITPEHKAIIEAKRKEGVDAYCARLRQLVYNAQVSLRSDLEKANIKADPRTFASDGDLKNLELLVKYQSRKEDDDQKKIDKIKELEKALSKGQ